MADNIPRATAGRLLLLFALLLMAVAAGTWRDSARRAEIEQVEYPTALGDANFCPPEALTTAGGFSGRLFSEDRDAIWSPAGEESVKFAENRLYKVGSDVASRFFLYQPGRGPQAASYFVKMADGIFREVKRAE